jgi:hypothetical protein
MAIVYRSDILPEIAAVATVQLAQGLEPLAARSFDQLETQIKSLSSNKPLDVLKVLGSSYSPEQLQGLQKTYQIGQVEIFLYAGNATARKIDPTSASLAPLVYHLVDETQCSYATHMWQATMNGAPVPPCIALIDMRGRNDLTSDARTLPFCEWVQTQGASVDLLKQLITSGTLEQLDAQVRAGQSYLVKTDSGVSAIASAAGWYTSDVFSDDKEKARTLRVAVVDAQRLIELVADHLCTKQGADLAIITRFDHVALKSRYTFYTTSTTGVNALELARSMGYDAGGNARMAGFVSDESIAIFLTKGKMCQQSASRA